jgi:hypothetical protein
MGVDEAKRFGLFLEMLKAQGQDRVLEQIGEIARVESVSVIHGRDM